jgi:hypothetical protein
MIRGAPFWGYRVAYGCSAELGSLAELRVGCARRPWGCSVVGIPQQAWLTSRTETRWTGCGMYASLRDNEADIDGRAALPASVEDDPQRSLASQFCCDAQRRPW